MLIEVFRAFRRQLINIVRYPRYLLLMTLGVIFSYVFFLTALREGQPQKLPIAIVDQDGSYLSRRLCHEIAATQGVELVAVYNTHQQARNAMQRQKIYAFLEIPRGTYNDILSFRRTRMALYANNAYLLGGSFSYKTLATITKLASGAVQREVLRKKGYSEQQIMGLIQPIELDTHAISNPTVNYQPYILTTILPGIIALMIMMMTIYILQNWLLSPDAALAYSKGRVSITLLGKMLPYSVWFSILAVAGNMVLFGFLDFPIKGSFWSLSLALVMLVAASQAMGVFLVGMLPDQHLSICIGAIYGTLSFTMSGFSYPATNMLPAMQGFSYIFPLRHYYLSYVDICLYDSPFSSWFIHIAVLFAFLLAGFVGTMLVRNRLVREGALRRVHIQLLQSENHQQ